MSHLSREACVARAAEQGLAPEWAEAVGELLYVALRDLDAVERELLRDVEPTVSLTVQRWPRS